MAANVCSKKVESLYIYIYIYIYIYATKWKQHGSFFVFFLATMCTSLSVEMSTSAKEFPGRGRGDFAEPIRLGAAGRWVVHGLPQPGHGPGCPETAPVSALGRATRYMLQPCATWGFSTPSKGRPPFTSCNVQVYNVRIPACLGLLTLTFGKWQGGLRFGVLVQSAAVRDGQVPVWGAGCCFGVQFGVLVTGPHFCEIDGRVLTAPAHFVAWRGRMFASVRGAFGRCWRWCGERRHAVWVLVQVGLLGALWVLFGVLVTVQARLSRGSCSFWCWCRGWRPGAFCCLFFRLFVFLLVF